LVLQHREISLITMQLTRFSAANKVAAGRTSGRKTTVRVQVRGRHPLRLLIVFPQYRGAAGVCASGSGGVGVEACKFKLASGRHSGPAAAGLCRRVRRTATLARRAHAASSAILALDAQANAEEARQWVESWQAKQVRRKQCSLGCDVLALPGTGWAAAHARVAGG
jgi:hypothetical protein